jgi:hypothetical protein
MFKGCAQVVLVKLRIMARARHGADIHQNLDIRFAQSAKKNFNRRRRMAKRDPCGVLG